MGRAPFIFLLSLAAHFVVSLGHSRFATQTVEKDCSVTTPFNPWQWNVVALGNIGTSAAPYGADFEGAFAALGSVWLAKFTANANERGPVDFTWSASVGGSFWINGGNIANGGVEAKGDVHIESASIHGGVSTGGDLTIVSGNVEGTVLVQGDASYGPGAASNVHEGTTFQMSVDLSLVKKYFLGFSADIGSLAPTVASYDYKDKRISLTVGSGLQIVKIPWATLQDAASIEVTGNADTTLIINVEGIDVVFDDLTVVRKGGFAAGHLLVNFYQATTLTLGGQSEISILAPLADVTFKAGYIVGNLITNNLVGSGQTGQGSESPPSAPASAPNAPSAPSPIGGQVSDSNPFQPPPCPGTPPAAPSAPETPVVVPSPGANQEIPSPPEGPTCPTLSFDPWAWNVISMSTIGTPSKPYGADFQGSFLALGSVWLSGYTSNAKQTSVGSSVGGSFSLQGGDIAHGGIEVAGDVFLDVGTIQGNVNSGGSLTVQSGNINGDVNVKLTATYPPGAITGQVKENVNFVPSVDLAAVKNYLVSLSAYFAAQDDTPTEVLRANNKLTIVANSGFNYVKINWIELFDATELDLQGPADAILVFNVVGVDPSFDSLITKLSGGISEGRIILNFYQATSLFLTGGAAVTVLAPNADVTFPTGLIIGNLVAGSLSSSDPDGLGSGGQVNDMPTTPIPCPDTPPGSPVVVPPSPGAGQEVPSPPEECPISVSVNPWQWNVFVLGDIGTPGTPYGSDFEGAFAALGNVWVGGFTINALEYGSVDFQFSATVGGSFSIKGGDVENGGIEANGNVRIESASVRGNVNTGGNFQLVSGNVLGAVRAVGSASYLPNSIAGEVKTGVTHTLSVDLQEIANFFLSLSSTLGSKPGAPFDYANTMISLTVVDGVNYITVDAATLKAASVLSITGPAGATLVINVPDAKASFDSLVVVRAGGFESGHVIVNFYAATTLTLTGQSELSILAPKAAVVFPAGYIVGNLIAGSLFGSGQTGVSPANGTNSVGGQVGDSMKFNGTLPCPTDTNIPTPTPCPEGTAGSACQLVCPVFGGKVCGGLGTCSEGRTGTGHCICPPTRCGLACEAALSNGVCPLSCVSPFVCTAGEDCKWALASAGTFCNDGDADTFLDRCSVGGQCSGTNSAEPAVGTCRPCLPSDPGCYHPGVATQFWCDTTCMGKNSAACPTSHCRCGGSGTGAGGVSTAAACRPCAPTDPGCTHAGVANQDWCSWNCFAGFFYHGSCTASHCYCPAGELPTCTTVEIGSGSASVSTDASFCEDNCPAGQFNDADCSPDQCKCAAGYEGVTVLLRYNLPPGLAAIIAALCSANPEWQCNVDAVTNGGSTSSKRKMTRQDTSSTPSWNIRVKVEDPQGGTADMVSAVTKAIQTNAAMLRAQGMYTTPNVNVFGPDAPPQSDAPPAPPATPVAPPKKEKHDTGKVVGIAVGISVLVVLIALLAFVLCRRQKRKRAVARAGAIGTPYGASFRKGGVSMPGSTGVVGSPVSSFSPQTISRVNRNRSARSPGLQSPGAIPPNSTPVSALPTRTSSQRFDYV